ncbi:MAG: sigma-54-dependent Fis family transcriptional regulator, partial [Bacteroidetes bacterium]
MKVLIIDDELDMLRSLELLLTNAGMVVLTESNPEKGIKAAVEQNIDILLCDLFMPEIDGFQIIKSVLEKKPNLPIIIFSAYGTIERAVEAMKLGAYNFIEKPFNAEHLILLLKRAYEHSQLVEANTNLLLDESVVNFNGITTRNYYMKRVIELIKKASATDANVLITGESGTGKELVAKAIHKLSKRNNGPFVPVNCSALPVELFEAELFGYEKGSFTGANSSKIGLIEAANKGSFFMDEVFEIPPAVQVKMLRLLQEKSFRRIGGKEIIEADVRFIAATNKNKEESLNSGFVREDFYYRLNVLNIDLPPLRERKDDIILLAELYLDKYSQENGKSIEGFDDETIEKLLNYRWPGNVRELQNVIQRAVFSCNSNRIKTYNLSGRIKENIDPDKFNSKTFAEAKRETLE